MCTISVWKCACDVRSWSVLCMPAHTERAHYVPFLNPFPLIIIIMRKSLKWSVARSSVPALMLRKLNLLFQEAHKQPLTAKSDQIRNLMIHEEVQNSNLRLTTNMTLLYRPALYLSSSMFRILPFLTLVSSCWVHHQFVSDYISFLTLTTLKAIALITLQLPRLSIN